MRIRIKETDLSLTPADEVLVLLDSKLSKAELCYLHFSEIVYISTNFFLTPFFFRRKK